MIDLHEPNKWLNDATGRVMRHWQVYEALGLNPKKHLPDEGVAPKLIGNVIVHVAPKCDYPQDATRTWAICPVCQKDFTAGKLRQHLAVHKS